MSRPTKRAQKTLAKPRIDFECWAILEEFSPGYFNLQDGRPYFDNYQLPKCRCRAEDGVAWRNKATKSKRFHAVRVRVQTV